MNTNRSHRPTVQSKIYCITLRTSGCEWIQTDHTDLHCSLKANQWRNTGEQNILYYSEDFRRLDCQKKNHTTPQVEGDWLTDCFIKRMTVLGRGLVFQPVLVTQTCTYNSNNITLQNIDIQGGKGRWGGGGGGGGGGRSCTVGLLFHTVW